MKQKLLTLLLALISMTAWATDYNLWIKGKRVTDANAADLSVISGVEGTMWYDVSKNTLYMSDVSFGGSVNTGIWATDEVTIHLDGMNAIEISGPYGLYLDDRCTITGNGSLSIKASDCDIKMYNSDKLTITGGASVYLQGNGIDNDGDWSETLVVDGASLFIHGNDNSWSPSAVNALQIRNAHLELPAWKTYTWNQGYFVKNGQQWKGDICIRANMTAGSGDVDGNGYVALADVTKLVNMILHPESGSGSGSGSGTTNDDEPTGYIGNYGYVDLGLPSGTLWAECNIGASCPEGLGDYFAWGETVPYGGTDTSNATNHDYMGNSYTKIYYGWNTYKYCNGSENSLTKYYSVDARTELTLSDDAAYVNWGNLWHMPSKEQFEELVNTSYTTMELTRLNDVPGLKITSKVNGKSIFLPHASHRDGDGLATDNTYGVRGWYWSRDTYGSNHRMAYILTFMYKYKFAGEVAYVARYYGCPIRPIHTGL